MAVIVGPSLWIPSTPEEILLRFGCYSLGDEVKKGGYLICSNGGVAWIVAPNTSEVSRTWYCREDAVITATACSNINTWFVPTTAQLSNPGYSCRTYWDSYASNYYWSSTEGSTSTAWATSLGSGYSFSFWQKNYVFCARAFRCVIY